jgi:tripartite ATP-independent transporter DctP family solute receptor
MDRPVHRRDFLARAGAAAALLAGCRSRRGGGPIVLRLSHAMTAGPTALHAFAAAFRELAEAATGGAVEVRLFPSGTLGQEREVVQQLQEGLVDFMVSGTAIWGSVAPKLQCFDFPFLWRDWDHVHGVVDARVGREAADYMEAALGVRPLAWGDSFGFRQVITRSREVSEPAELRGLKIRTIQSPIYVKAVELMGASPTPMAFGEVYTSLQTGVIDGYEHDASTTLQQRFFEVARFMARTRHIAGVLGLFASAVGLARLPPGLRPKLEAAALEAARRQRAMGDAEDRTATGRLAEQGMTIREIDRGAFLGPAAALWQSQARELGAESWLQAALA